MKLSDYIVKLIKEQGCTDIFGYQGGMIAHFVDSLSKEPTINIHTLLNEQSCGFAACGYAQSIGKIGWAFASSGPGATNFITAICNAYYDSVPVIFITGQVNTNEAKGRLRVRQKAFQETDIISIVKSITKDAFCIERSQDVKYIFQKAIYIANNGRKGPVLIDIPMNIQRANIEESELDGFIPEDDVNLIRYDIKTIIENELKKSERPVFIFGNGFKTESLQNRAKGIVEKYNIPVVTSMLGCDVLESDNQYNYGFIGAYGHRVANFILAKSDLIITLGTRLDVRQIGGNKKEFAPNATIIRFDIDEAELENKIKDNEIQFRCSLNQAINYIMDIDIDVDFSGWIEICDLIKKKLDGIDTTIQNEYIFRISNNCSKRCVITTDVGQNQVWVAQSFKISEGQRILFSGGHGAMGYSLPAAIGAYYATHEPVICFCGDGGLQMTIQELQIIKTYNIPVIIFLLNNSSLGMIRHFQEMFFEGRYVQTMNNHGYSVPDFISIARAYGIEGISIDDFFDKKMDCYVDKPILVNIQLDEKTYIKPKLEFGKPNQDQEPLINRKLYGELMKL